MKIKHTSLLLPVLLGGCNLPHSRTGLSDPGQFVEAQIAIQLQSIQRSQNELKRAADGYGSEQKKPKPMTSKSATTLTPDKLRNLSHVKSLGPPDTFTWISVRASNHLPESLLRQMIPPGWQLIISADLNKKFTQRTSFDAGDQWPYVLNRYLSREGLVALIDWPGKKVSVAFHTPAFTSSPVLATAPATMSPGNHLQPKALPIAGVPRNPFSDDRRQTPKTPPPATAVAPKLPPVPTPKVWRAEQGSTLKDTIFTWAAQEQCTGGPNGSWSVDWPTEVNYRVDAPLSFTGTFREALSGVFRLYSAASVPLYAATSTPQCLLRVTSGESR